ncbi:OmpH family outer membrane protein [Desulfocurvus sp. DL9XJH121]
MKFRLILAALAATLLLAACQQQGGAKIAVIDPSEVFKACEVCKKGGEYLKAKSEAMRAELTALQAAAKGGEDKEASAKFQERYTVMQNDLMGEQTRIAGLLNDAFTKVVKEYREKNGVSLVLSREDVLSMDDSADITAAVIKAMDTAAIDLALPEVKAPEAAPAEAPKAEEAAPAGDKKAE